MTCRLVYFAVLCRTVLYCAVLDEPKLDCPENRGLPRMGTSQKYDMAIMTFYQYLILFDSQILKLCKNI